MQIQKSKPCSLRFICKHSVELLVVERHDEDVLLLAPLPAVSHLPTLVVLTDSERID
jgi:hypothetical protein